MADAPNALVPVSPRLAALANRYQPQNLTELMAWSKIVVDSQLAPKGMNAAAVVLCVQMGAEIGVTPAQAIQNTAVINGRPSIYGDLGLAIFLRDAAYKTFEERQPDAAFAAMEGWCKIVMKDGRVIETKFTKADAVTAKLWGKQGPWTDQPGVMFMFRARWRAMRSADPGVFKGFSPREEMEDFYSAGHTPEGVEILRPQAKAQPGTAPAAASAAPPPPAPELDRSQLVKVLVKNMEKKTPPPNKETGKVSNPYYVLTYETGDGQTLTASTFSATANATGERLKGRFALIATKKVERGGQTFNNLLHIEELVDDAPEPGSAG